MHRGECTAGCGGRCCTGGRQAPEGRRHGGTYVPGESARGGGRRTGGRHAPRGVYEGVCTGGGGCTRRAVKQGGALWGGHTDLGETYTPAECTGGWDGGLPAGGCAPGGDMHPRGASGGVHRGGSMHRDGDLHPGRMHRRRRAPGGVGAPGGACTGHMCTRGCEPVG